MDFELSEEQRIFQKAIRDFAEKEIKPLVDEAEENEKFPKQLYKRMGELNLLCINYPEEYGGSEVDGIMECIYSEELGRICCGIATGILTQSIATYPIYKFGSEEQKKKYIPQACKGEKIFVFAITEANAGSDILSIETKAVKKGEKYIINGTKMFIGNGTIADYVLTAAYVDKSKGMDGIALFIVDTKKPGFSARKLKKLGNRSNENAEIVFENVEVSKEDIVGEETGGFPKLIESLSKGRFIIASRNIGIAQVAFEDALGYAKERIQFGRPIAKFQAISFKLAKMATLIKAARIMNYEVAWLFTAGKKFSMEASMSKLFATEMAQWVTNAALQIYGGYGYMMEFPIQRYFRDARAGTIVEGTSEIQHIIIAKGLGL